MQLCRRLVAVAAISLLSVSAYAQPTGPVPTETAAVNKPYKILTAGRQITIKSTKEIKSIMVWTSSGHRIIEERQVNTSSYSFNINVSEKVFFVMIQYEGAKPFTEKIWVGQ